MIGNWIEVLRTCNLSGEKKMDPVSKWLLITRACVFPMTILSGLLGGMLAALNGHFNGFNLFLVVVGLTIAHAANNMVNDYWDVRHNVDTADYPRAKYAPHPILDNMLTTRGIVTAIGVCYALDFAIAVYFSYTIGVAVMGFAAAGAFFSVAYVAPPLKLKHRGLGEPAIFMIWGPLMIVGSYYVMAKSAPVSAWLESIPYGLAVTSVLMGKHLDKAEKDREKGVKTLPVVLGDKRGKLLTQLLVLSFYFVIVALVCLGYLPWPALIALFSLPHAIKFVTTLSLATPETPQVAFEMAKDVIPEDLKAQFDPNLSEDQYPLWPLWYVAWGVWWTRVAGGLFVAGLLAALGLKLI